MPAKTGATARNFGGTKESPYKYDDLNSLMCNALGNMHQEEIADMLKDMGNAFFVDDEYEKSIRCYTLAATSYAPKPVYTCGLAAAYLRLNLYAETEAAATLCLLYDPKSIRARYRRAVARKALGRVNAAIQDLRVIAENSPSFQDGVQLLKEIDHKRDYELDPSDEYPAYRAKTRDVLNSSTKERNDDLSDLNRSYSTRIIISELRSGESGQHNPSDIERSSDYSEMNSTAVVGHLPGYPRNAMSINAITHEDIFSDQKDSDEEDEDEGETEEDGESILHKDGLGGISARRLRCVNGCVACKNPIDDDSLLIIIVTLEQKYDSFDDTQKTDMQKLHSNAPIVQVYTVESGLHALNRTGPTYIYVSDAGISLPTARPLAKRIKECVEQGDRVVFGAQFGCRINPEDVAPFFKSTFNIPWTSGSFFLGNFVKNAKHPVVEASDEDMADTCRMSVLSLSGFKTSSVVYFDEGSLLNEVVESPVLCTKVGKGLVGYIGDLNAEEESAGILLGMFGLPKKKQTARYSGPPRGTFAGRGSLGSRSSSRGHGRSSRKKRSGR